MSKYTSRSAARAQDLQRQAASPFGADVSSSIELFRILDNTCPGLTAAEAARRVIASESPTLRRCASYQVLARLGPLLDKLELMERLA